MKKENNVLRNFTWIYYKIYVSVSADEKEKSEEEQEQTT